LVTQEQWKAVTGDNPSHFKGEANLPVENVSWNLCQAFLRQLTQRDGLPYRLPSEAEWEYACRSGTTTPFHFGDAISTDQANYDGNYAYGNGKKGVYREKTTPVGSFPPNLWGLYDMHGNVWQMCQDWYDGHPTKEVVDPHGPAAGQHRTIRGGSWITYPDYCRAAYRRPADPGECRTYYGLRVCLSLD
jgi:formylglycine-generating enzyme required for sulfatase activity